MKKLTSLEAGIGGRVFRMAIVLSVAVGLATFAMAQQQKKKTRRLGTCGPPPRKNPQRQTSAEGFPPLPLPVTPLRRSEPKAEPAPPPGLAERAPTLLSDSQMIEFVKNGFVVLPLPELSPEYHAKCADSIMNPWEKNDRNNNWIGNNIYPANADLGPVLATPTVRGALSSVLGPDYAFHAHRALHRADRSSRSRRGDGRMPGSSS